MSLLERNLEALRRWMPVSASRIAAAAIPSGFAPATGTDGSATYRRVVVTSEQKRVEWPGGTSMPRSSAEALATGLDAAAGNGLGLSIGTGYEWAAFAKRLAPLHAIFVYEDDAATVRMALEMCDLTDLLSTGRILLLTGPAESAGQELSTFISDHIGFEPPRVLHPLATLRPERRNACLTAGEAMVRRAVQERQLLEHQWASRVEAGMAETTDAVVAMTLTPRYTGERPLLSSCESTAAVVTMDRHDSASMALRLKTIADHQPRKIVSDLFRGQLGCVPPKCVVETWVPPLAGPAYWDQSLSSNGLWSVDRVVVHGESQRTRLAEAGVPAQAIELRPLPVGASVNSPSVATANRGERVVLFGDLVTLEAEKLGIALPTHLAVFEAAAEIIRAEHLGLHEGMAKDILRRALDRAAVQTTGEGALDTALREPMLRLVRNVLIPTLPLVTLAQAWIAEGIPLCLMGDWAGFAAGAGADVTFVPLSEMNWQDASLFVHLSPTGMPSPVLWQAVAAGVPVVAPQHPTDRQAGALPTLLKPDVEFAHPGPRQLLNVVKTLLKDAERRNRLAAAASARLQSP